MKTIRVTQAQVNAIPFVDFQGDLAQATWEDLEPSYNSMLHPDARRKMAWAGHLGDRIRDERAQMYVEALNMERSFRQSAHLHPETVFHR